MEVSYTELEFDTATEAGMTRLVFLFDLEADLGGIPPSRLIDMDNIDKRQLAFRSRVQASLAAPLFTDPETLQRLADRSLRYLATRGTQAVTPPGTGRLLTDVKNPFDLEVHRPVRPTRRHPGLPELPGYVRRDHDDQLAEEVRAAAAGTSGTVVLVGGSSTGKTRACWEALDLLRDLPAPWRLWHRRPGSSRPWTRGAG
jgi:hypothetical protein